MATKAMPVSPRSARQRAFQVPVVWCAARDFVSDVVHDGGDHGFDLDYQLRAVFKINSKSTCRRNLTALT